MSYLERLALEDVSYQLQGAPRRHRQFQGNSNDAVLEYSMLLEFQNKTFMTRSSLKNIQAAAAHVAVLV